MRLLQLVRHGQASFGKDDYDALSELGHAQARLLGRTLAERGTRPDLVIRGDLRRHRETAEGIAAGLDLALGRDVAVEVDAGWNEFDFDHVVAVLKPEYASKAAMLAELELTGQPRAAYQRLFEEATVRWSGGAADDDYAEPFGAFVERVRGALRRAAELVPESGTVLVVSSGGPIGLVASVLLAGDASLWTPLNRVAVNTAVTKVLHGRSGMNLLSYNDHSHVEHDRELLTYR